MPYSSTLRRRLVCHLWLDCCTIVERYEGVDEQSQPQVGNRSLGTEQQQERISSWFQLDTKLSNMFVQRQPPSSPAARGGNWSLKGADHGCMVKREGNNVCAAVRAGVGTIGYAAPETEAAPGHQPFACRKTHQYALGAVLYNLCHQQTFDTLFHQWHKQCDPLSCVCLLDMLERLCTSMSQFVSLSCAHAVAHSSLAL